MDKSYRVVVCTDVSGKELHRQSSVGRVIASGCLGGVMVRILASQGQEAWVRILLYAQYFPHDNDKHTYIVVNLTSNKITATKFIVAVEFKLTD